MPKSRQQLCKGKIGHHCFEVMKSHIYAYVVPETSVTFGLYYGVNT